MLTAARRCPQRLQSCCAQTPPASGSGHALRASDSSAWCAPARHERTMQSSRKLRVVWWTQFNTRLVSGLSGLEFAGEAGVEVAPAALAGVGGYSGLRVPMAVKQPAATAGRTRPCIACTDRSLMHIVLHPAAWATAGACRPADMARVVPRPNSDEKRPGQGGRQQSACRQRQGFLVRKFSSCLTQPVNWIASESATSVVFAAHASTCTPDASTTRRSSVRNSCCICPCTRSVNTSRQAPAAHACCSYTCDGSACRFSRDQQRRIQYAHGATRLSGQLIGPLTLTMINRQ